MFALVLLPAFIMNLYAKHQYNLSLLKHSIYTEQDDHTQPTHVTKNLVQAYSEANYNNGIFQNDLECILKQASTFKRFKEIAPSNYCKSRTRKSNLLAKAEKRLEKSLDIRKIADLRTNIKLLLKSLMSDEQRLLFRWQNQRAIDDDFEATKHSSSDSDKIGQESYEQLKFKVAKLHGFKPTTQLDRQLLKGIFKPHKSSKTPDLTGQGWEIGQLEYSDVQFMQKPATKVQHYRQFTHHSDQQLIQAESSQQTQVIILQDLGIK